ncbi:lipase family protein [Rhodococcus daqingensis]|uniref:Lipase family protein n=1 Tax=Rhodococcus daqingensis TaxID=2479363 RepID=A0ABW2RYG4_9NOCA
MMRRTAVVAAAVAVAIAAPGMANAQAPSNPSGDPSLDWLYGQNSDFAGGNGSLGSVGSSGSGFKDAFYNPPANIASLANGAIIRERVVQPIPIIGGLTKQLAYKSTDSHGKPIVTVTTVFTPAGCNSGAGGSLGSLSAGSSGGGDCVGKGKLVSYQHATNSLGMKCQPSVIFSENNPINALSVAVPFLQQTLARGYTVSAPDTNGPLGSFIAGYSEGHSVLDGIRATEAHLGLSADTEVALVGQSGGAHATAWGAQLKDKYAPELNVISAAMAGPPLDILATGNANNGKNQVSYLYFAAVVGLFREFPQEAQPNGFFTAEGKEIVKKYGDACMLGEGMNGYSGIPLQSLTNWPDQQDPIPSWPPALQVGLDNQAAKPGEIPTDIPMLIIHGNEDQIVPVGSTTAMVGKYCAGGATVDYRIVPGGHVDTSINHWPDLLDYTGDRFAHKAPGNTC